MYEYKYRVKIRDTDASGRLFFAAQFCIAHEAFEAFMEEKNLSTGKLLYGNEMHLPIVHAETDYQRQTRAGDHLKVEVTCIDIGQRSFTLGYTLTRQSDQAETGTVQTVHVPVNPETGKSMGITDQLREILQTLKIGHR